MAVHDKVTLVREYCLCRKIPYRVLGGDLGQVVIGNKDVGTDVIYSIYNIPWAEIIQTIDGMVVYDDFGRFERMRWRVYG